MKKYIKALLMLALMPYRAFAMEGESDLSESYIQEVREFERICRESKELEQVRRERQLKGKKPADPQELQEQEEALKLVAQLVEKEQKLLALPEGQRKENTLHNYRTICNALYEQQKAIADLKDQGNDASLLEGMKETLRELAIKKIIARNELNEAELALQKAEELTVQEQLQILLARKADYEKTLAATRKSLSEDISSSSSGQRHISDAKKITQDLTHTLRELEAEIAALQIRK